MFPLKRYIALIFIITLLTPTIIKSSHAFFEDHEHIVCTSKTDQHIHELENDCKELHLQLEIFNFSLNNNYELFAEQNYVNKSVEKAQQLKGLFFSHKSSRGPPSL